jgi:hypothetical protein
MRDDLKLAAYAVACGFTLKIDGGKRPFAPSSFIAGIPHDGLSFERNGTHVWETARGWRVATLEGDRFPKPQDSDFHRSLLKALDAAQVQPMNHTLGALGFVRVDLGGGCEIMRHEGARGFINVSDTRGVALPTELNWAVSVWTADSGDEADSDYQAGDTEGPQTLAAAVGVALARLAQIDAA